MSRKIIQQALDALKNGKLVREGEGGTQYQPDLEEKAIAALEAELAKPEQEPVAWHSHNPDYPIQDGDWVEVIFTSGQPDDAKKWTPLYTAPQKPDVTLTDEGKTWQGLTDDEMLVELKNTDASTVRLPPGFKYFARAIEAKLREKNT